MPALPAPAAAVLTPSRSVTRCCFCSGATIGRCVTPSISSAKQVNNPSVTLSSASLAAAAARHRTSGPSVASTHVCAACVCRSESSAGVGDGDDGGAQSEQGGQEMGDQSGPGTQEHHPLQESKTAAEPSLRKPAEVPSDSMTCLFFVFFSSILSVWRSATASACRPASRDDWTWS